MKILTYSLFKCIPKNEYISQSLCPNIFVSGNDESDVKCLNLAGLSAVPMDAPAVACNAAKYTCHCKAGRGAVREFAEHILLLKTEAKSQMGRDRIDKDQDRQVNIEENCQSGNQIQSHDTAITSEVKTNSISKLFEPLVAKV